MTSGLWLLLMAWCICLKLQFELFDRSFGSIC